MDPIEEGKAPDGKTGEGQDLDVSLSDLPDDLTSLEEIQKHMAGGGKKDEDKIVDPKVTEIENRLNEMGKTNEMLMGLIQRLAQGKAPQETQAQEINFFKDIEGDDVPTASQINNALVSLTQVVKQALTGINTRTSKSDFNDVVSDLPNLLKERPDLAQAMQTGDMNLIQYHMADMFRQLKGKGKPNNDEMPDEVQRILTNLGKPGPSALTNSRQPANKGQWVDNLNDDDFGKLVNQVINGNTRIGKGG